MTLTDNYMQNQGYRLFNENILPTTTVMGKSVGQSRPIVKTAPYYKADQRLPVHGVDTGQLFPAGGVIPGTYRESAALPFQSYSPYHTFPTTTQTYRHGDSRNVFNTPIYQHNGKLTNESAATVWPHTHLASNLNPLSKTFIPEQPIESTANESNSYEHFPAHGSSQSILDLSQQLKPAGHVNRCQSPEEVSSINDIALSLEQNLRVSPTLQISPTSSVTSPWSAALDTNQVDVDSESEDEGELSHPNKYPVEIEYHDNKHCSYRRQATRSGEKIKQRIITCHNAQTLEPETEVQQVKYYQKHLVRICRCGKYTQMDGALQHGRNNDCNGYEIHYSQKCRWKAYDDFRTGKRVLIRLCKCYKPQI